MVGEYMRYNFPRSDHRASPSMAVDKAACDGEDVPLSIGKCSRSRSEKVGKILGKGNGECVRKGQEDFSESELQHLIC
jgi:hypothetical protein